VRLVNDTSYLASAEGDLRLSNEKAP